MVSWIQNNIPPSPAPAVLEVGSGNGILLYALAEARYWPERLWGIDYSPDAIKLAQSLAPNHQGKRINFQVCDFLGEEMLLQPHMSSGGRKDVWDLILDKGTFDAIALGEKDAEGRSPAEQYPDRVARLLKPGGHFLITCAWPTLPSDLPDAICRRSL